MEKATLTAVGHNKTAIFSFASHPVKFKMYLLKNLPAALFSGVELVTATDKACTVSVPYKHFTRNPFRSTYFACLSMAAEMSTGLLAMAMIYGQKPPVSMLITGMRASFHQKAKSRTFFSCYDGDAIRDAIVAAINTRQSQTVKAHSTGKNEAGELIAEFWFTWSFKAK